MPWEGSGRPPYPQRAFQGSAAGRTSRTCEKLFVREGRLRQTFDSINNGNYTEAPLTAVSALDVNKASGRRLTQPSQRRPWGIYSSDLLAFSALSQSRQMQKFSLTY